MTFSGSVISPVDINIALTGVSSTGSVGLVTVTVTGTSALTFDSTSVTLDSTSKTFDEG